MTVNLISHKLEGKSASHCEELFKTYHQKSETSQNWLVC